MQAHPQRGLHLAAALFAFGLLQPATVAAEITLEDTRNGSQFKVEADSEQAKQFLATGKNPYIGDKNAIAAGKKLYQLYSCAQCHGAQAQGGHFGAGGSKSARPHGRLRCSMAVT